MIYYLLTKNRVNLSVNSGEFASSIVVKGEIDRFTPF